MKHANKILSRLSKSFKDEDGAITVDWVVLTAAIVGLAIAVLTSVGGAAMDQSDLMGDTMTSMGIRTY